jgi:peptidoglycan-associated lipoprotein
MVSSFHFLLYQRKEGERMFKKSSIWLVVLISVVAIAFVASGCAKKQVVKEEAAPKPAVEAKKEETKPEVPQPVEKPKEEAPKPPVAPPVEKPQEIKEEAKPEAVPKPEAAPRPEEKPVSIDPAGLRIQFAFDDYNLSTQSKENLEKIAKWMSKNPNARIQIQGHTCDIGTAEYNLALGDRRANSAKKYLEALGLSADRLSTISYGLEKPLVPNTNEENRSKNRRDEFVESK